MHKTRMAVMVSVLAGLLLLAAVPASAGMEGASTPGFAAVVAVIGLLAVYLRRKA